MSNFKRNHGIVEWNCIKLPLIKNDLEYPDLWLEWFQSFRRGFL